MQSKCQTGSKSEAHSALIGFKSKVHNALKVPDSFGIVHSKCRTGLISEVHSALQLLNSVVYCVHVIIKCWTDFKGMAVKLQTC